MIFRMSVSTGIVEKGVNFTPSSSCHEWQERFALNQCTAFEAAVK